MKGWDCRSARESLIAILFLLALLFLSSADAQEGELAEVRRLDEQVYQYYAAGQYQRAIPIAQRALMIRERALAPEHSDIALSLNNLGMLYFTIDDYAKAEPLYRRALEIREKVLGYEHPDTAVSLMNLGGLYQATDDYAKAEQLFKRALVITEKAPGPDYRNVATALNNLAGLYLAIGSYAKAKPLYQRALTITEKALGKHRDTAGSLNNLVELYRDTARSLHSLAELYRVTGAYVEAEKLYQRALAIKEEVLGPEHPEIMVSLNNLATLYQATGDYPKAEQLFKRALTISVKVLGSENSTTARALNNLGLLYYDTHAYEMAEPLYQGALAIYENVRGPENTAVAACLNNLAQLYQAIGDYAKAEQFFKRALAIKEKVLGPGHPGVAITLTNLAALNYYAGAYAKAKPLYQRALTITEKALGPEHPITAQSVNNLAALYQAIGVNTKAESFFERAQDIYEINTARFLLSGDEVRKRAYLQQRLRNAYANASFSLAVADPRGKALGLTAVLRYKGRVLDAMTDTVAQLRRSVDPRDHALFDELAAVAQQFSTMTFRGPDGLSIQAYRERVDALARGQERLEGELSERSAAFRQAVVPITLEGVRKGLPADAVLVEWFRYQPFDPKAKDENARLGTPPRYVAYILRHEGDPSAIDLGAAHDIDKLVGDFRTALSDPACTSSYKEVAQQLYKALFKPMQTSLSGINRLFLSPDAQLNLVPFAALIDENGQYVAQHLEVTYLTSGRDLLTSTPEPARGLPVVMADPDYGQSTRSPPSNLAWYRSSDLDRSGLVFGPLSGTAHEAEALRELLKLGAQQVLTGANATEEKLKGLHGPRILHVATHAFFLSDQEVAAGAFRPVNTETRPLPLAVNTLLRSGLALAGANARHSGENDDGILTAAEAAQLDLRGTQLVVLSACETGLGQVQQGEGVYGLRRALVLAGAQAQMVSLWKVADAQTQVLMVDYYEHLLKGEGRSEALREAQKAMIANPATQHPHYWAAFLPIGNWMPLITKSAEQSK